MVSAWSGANAGAAPARAAMAARAAAASAGVTHSPVAGGGSAGPPPDPLARASVASAESSVTKSTNRMATSFPVPRSRVRGRAPTARPDRRRDGVRREMLTRPPGRSDGKARPRREDRLLESARPFPADQVLEEPAMETGSPVPPPPPPGPAATNASRMSPTAALGGGWNALKGHFWTTMGVVLTLWVLIMIGSCIPAFGLLFGILVTPALVSGLAGYFVRTVRGEKPLFAVAFEGFERWPAVTGAYLIASAVAVLIMLPMFVILIGSLGLAILLHPADIVSRGGDWMRPAMMGPFFLSMVVCYPVLAWWVARTYVVVFAVMEPDRPGAITAFTRAWALTSGSVWRMIGLYLLGIPVVLLGCLALCVGILPAVAVIYLSFAHAYEQLRARQAGAAA